MQQHKCAAYISRLSFAFLFLFFNHCVFMLLKVPTANVIDEKQHKANEVCKATEKIQFPFNCDLSVEIGERKNQKVKSFGCSDFAALSS